MKRLTTWYAHAIACFLLLAAITAQAQDKKADPTGTWTWSTPGRDGGAARESTLKLKMEGEKLVGTLAGMRGGETKIDNAKVAGDEISFDVTRDFGGNSFTAKYKGKIKDDTITGKVARVRDGETRESEWVAKRKKDDKKEEPKK